jgi:tRNA1Val (adenine37-N6)-methyltransferase
MSEVRWEELAAGVRLAVSGEHALCADALLLAQFSARRAGRAADLGAGCGSIAVSLLTGPTPPGRVDAVELQDAAVELLRQTAAQPMLQGHLFPFQADLRRLEGILPAGCYDLVVCNPPYYPAGTVRPSSRPSGRMAREEGGCTLPEVCQAAARLLRPGGRFCLCLRPERLTDLLCALRAYDLEPKRLRLVHAAPQRPPWLVLAEGCRAGRPGGLRVEPPLVLGGG